MRPIRRVRLLVLLAVLAFAGGLTAPTAALAKDPPAFPRSGTDVLARDSWIVILAAGFRCQGGGTRPREERRR